MSNNWLKESQNAPDKFWEQEAEKFLWTKKWEKVKGTKSEGWFAGGITNLCVNALDRHAEGRNRGKGALIWESAELNESVTMTYWKLWNDVKRFAGALKNMGLFPGDRVMIYMPMSPELVISVMGSVRIGAVPCVVWHGSGVVPLMEKLEQVRPRVVVTVDGFKYKGQKVAVIPTLERAIEEVKIKPNYVVVCERGLFQFKTKTGREVSWNEAINHLGEYFTPPTFLDANSVCSFVFTSGATGKPKMLQKKLGETMVALSALARSVNITEDDVIFSAGEVGSAQSLDDAVFMPLLLGATSVIYEGFPDYPTPGSWWEIVEKHGPTVLMCHASDLTWLRRFHSKWVVSHDLSALKKIVVYGEGIHAPIRKWIADMLKKPVIELYRQAEFTSPLMVSSADDVSSLVAGPAVNIAILDESSEVDNNRFGKIAVRSPFPAGYNIEVGGGESEGDSELFYSGDLGKRNEDGSYFVSGRVGEEIITDNEPLGSRLIEEVIASNFVVAESAVVQTDEITAFVVLKDNVPGTNPLKDEIKKAVEDSLGKSATPAKVLFLKYLPRTPSGKILRRVLKAMVAGEDIGDLSNIKNPDILPAIRDALRAARLK